jgi:hypothetical protein
VSGTAGPWPLGPPDSAWSAARWYFWCGVEPDLRDEGLLDFQRRRGITVAGTPERSAVMNRVRELVDFCRSQGYRPDEVIRIIEGLP